MITHVAVVFNGKMYSLPKPNRHHHVIKFIYDQTGQSVLKSWQGFLDHTGKFIGRTEAVKIARKCNQLNVIRPKTSPSHLLFSEDIW